MKSCLPLFLLLALSFSTSAQNKKVTVFCKVDAIGRVHYGHLEKFLPVGLKASVLLDPRKEHNLRDADDVLLWMYLHDWKLASVISDTGGNGMVTTSIIYLLSQEIDMNEADRASFTENLENTGKKRAK